MGIIRKERKMKVYGATVASRRTWYTSSKYNTVPQIRLQGLWLEKDCGFQPGTPIKVECHKIVILQDEKKLMINPTDQ